LTLEDFIKVSIPKATPKDMKVIMKWT